MNLFEEILKARGLEGEARKLFLSPQYEKKHDPFLLPDMHAAVERLVFAREKQEKITIYGDYDIDGLTATTVLLDAFESFGFENVDAFIPNRFVEGYGLTVDAVEKIAATGAQLVVTVDCGSLSKKEIERANELGVDIIVTDHHNVMPLQPPAVAVINPKRLLMEHPEMYENYMLKPAPASPASAPPKSSETASLRASTRAPASLEARAADVSEDLAVQSHSLHLSSEGLRSPLGRRPNAMGELSAPHKVTRGGNGGAGGEQQKLYPFLDLPGVGVAFKLVQALQTRLPGLPAGQEKWLLDLVALGTVCDVVTLVDENRTHVYWGLKVLAKTRRPGLKALMAVAKVEPEKINARHLGFGLGPRMNAAGRLETAQYALDMLRAGEGMAALEKAQQLDTLNALRRSDQDKIFKAAVIQAQQFENDPVLVVSHPDWNHGIIGIVAAKLLEKYKKPTYVLQEMGEESKGSARSYGDFSAADAIRASDDIIIKGGGHKLAAGVTMPTKNIAAFRQRVNEFYRSLKLADQASLLLPKADVTVAELAAVSEQFMRELERLEPFGSGNPEPVFKSEGLLVTNQRRMGADAQHVKLELRDATGRLMQFLAFNAPGHFFVEPGEYVTVWYQPIVNEWQGRRTVEGRLLHLESA